MGRLEIFGLLDPSLPHQIHLPPEPPKDRVIEARDAHGCLLRSWAYDRDASRWICSLTGEDYDWALIAYEVQDSRKYETGMRSLWSVPTESGESK